MRIIYLGTPEFAVPTLKALIKEPGFEVVAVVCQPDRPSGRGNKVQAPPVKVVALENGTPVLQPIKLAKEKDIVEAMRALKPDVIVMVAFGQILKKPVLEMAPLGVINLHGSLLPSLRGAAPINWAIINGHEKAGNTTMCTDVGVDTGAMLLKNEVPIELHTDAVELARLLSESGADLMVETLKKLEAGAIEPVPQDDSQASYAPLLDRSLSNIDWSQEPLKIHNLVRGLVPWPGTVSQFRDEPLKIIKTAPVDSASPEQAGLLIKAGKRILVACGKEGKGRLQLITVQPRNKPKMQAADWANGIRLESGEKLSKVTD
ncbi:MAG: methionyl-tRNA formyltransferase [Candidatus Obscuribacterales bacterium]|nr:methionyl-tRNA formyltransferase [Candidatus Obscuribacterales bacterium]